MPLAGLARLGSLPQEPRLRPAPHSPPAQPRAKATMAPKMRRRTLPAPIVPRASTPPPPTTSASPASLDPSRTPGLRPPRPPALSAPSASSLRFRRRSALSTPGSQPAAREKSRRLVQPARMRLAGLAMLVNGQREPRTRPASRTPRAATRAKATMGAKLRVKTLPAPRAPRASTPPPPTTSASTARRAP